MIVFAAGNKYKVSEGENMIRKSERAGGHTLWYVTGYRWIKSKQKFSGQALIHYVGEGEPVEVKE